MHKKYLDQLNNSVRLSKGPRIVRVLRQPTKMITAKLLQNIAHLLNKSFKVRAELFCKKTMMVIIPEIVSLHIFRYRYFEEGLTRMVLELLKPGMIFFDVGAHFGYYTLLASDLVGRDGQVHAFEPIPRTLEVLKLNTRSKHNISTNNLAIFSTNTVLELYDYGLEYCAFNSFKDPRLDKNKRKRLKPQKVLAKAITLDAYVKEEGARPDFVKIDAESAEWEILQGMTYILRNIRPIISLEIGDLRVQDVPPSRDLVRYIIEQGYEVYQYGSLDQPLVKHEVRVNYNYDNLLFIPK